MTTSLTYSTVARIAAGNYRERVVDILADGTYTASGYTLASADYQSMIGGAAATTTASISKMIAFTCETNAGGVTASLDRTNSKLLFFEAGAVATTTISSKTVRVFVKHGLSNYS